MTSSATCDLRWQKLQETRRQCHREPPVHFLSIIGSNRFFFRSGVQGKQKIPFWQHNFHFRPFCAILNFKSHCSGVTSSLPLRQPFKLKLFTTMSAPKIAIVIYSMYGHVAKRKFFVCVCGYRTHPLINSR
jgi:hypothetical protein